jgi:predicted transcriptional regulator
VAIQQPIKQAIKRKYPAINHDQNVYDAMQLMVRSNSSALVVKLGDELIGIVTVADILQCLAEDVDPGARSISSFMTKCDLITDKETDNPCLQLDENLDIMAAVKVMYQAGVNHLLISGPNNEPVGIVSSMDLLKSIVR